ncbi:NADAR family protein [Frankia sp. CNm7]|uniref:NADAR family protein n=2 Tax=Frankia nepalensis TaxID=1836974 RepID=A0A937RVE9_9ACTN|nr:NADAR family protein [Frankia nepalensis]MBL7512259.1 NADAR family protein [Frankia nepalensis]MBL7520456.1 NADAR family protein [Frankia nepalensis]MBL7632591.1 NADAR family protein [Frankia nepalensis]
MTRSGHPRRVDDLLQAELDGVALSFRFFWGHRPRAGGGVGASCLRQWFAAPFTADGRRYATAEHYMMAGKARLFGDDKTEQAILATQDPGRAKALGRRVRGFDETTWQRHRYEIVVAANLAKFTQHDRPRAFLLATGDDVLAEASPLDPVWGIGLAATDPRAHHPADWPGLNLLGFALMDVRAALRP